MTPPPTGARRRFPGIVTLVVTVGLVLLNLGVLPNATRAAEHRLARLQFDDYAIASGEWYRLLTGNFVHFNFNHFALDVGVFLVLGLLYERSFGRSYLWLLLCLCFGAGLGCLWFLPERTICRGLSGVDSGLFAAALCIEFGLAARDPRRWLWVGPAAALFLTKTTYEIVTGQSFFSTQNLLGPAALAIPAHVGGTVAGVVFVLVLYAWRRFRPDDQRSA